MSGCGSIQVESTQPVHRTCKWPRCPRTDRVAPRVRMHVATSLTIGFIGIRAIYCNSAITIFSLLAEQLHQQL